MLFKLRSQWRFAQQRETYLIHELNLNFTLLRYSFLLSISTPINIVKRSAIGIEVEILFCGGASSLRKRLQRIARPELWVLRRRGDCPNYRTKKPPENSRGLYCSLAIANWSFSIKKQNVPTNQLIC